MATTAQVQQGLVSFIDGEILPKVSGWQRWAIGTTAGLAASRSGAIIESLKPNPVVKALGVFDDDGSIDVERIYSELKKQAAKGPANIDIPMIGTITLTAADVDKLYAAIQAAG